MLIYNRRVRKVVCVWQAWGRQKFVHDLGGKTDRSEDLGIEGMIILKKYL
jgi:hypothetical protein